MIHEEPVTEDDRYSRSAGILEVEVLTVDIGKGHGLSSRPQWALIMPPREEPRGPPVNRDGGGFLRYCGL